MFLDDYDRIYEKHGNTGAEFRNIGDGVVQAGNYADWGEPDVQIEVTIAENRESMAEEIMDMLNFGRSITRGAVMIANERTRQIEKEGWDEGHDSNHKHGELALAGAVYALHDAGGEIFHSEAFDELVANVWPWDTQWLKPKDRLSNLVRAGALIAAEIDRILLAQEGSEDPK